VGTASLTFPVQITDDNTDEFDEQFVLVLRNPTNATLGSDSATIFTIRDNDMPAVAFSEDSYSVKEALTSIDIPVQLGTPHGDVVTVEYEVSNGTALAGSDYLSATGTLTFQPGDTMPEIPLSISILTDSDVEDPETIQLTLSNPVNAVLGDPSTATLTITDDDVPTVQFDSDSYDVDEGVGQATITVELNVPARDPVSVDYITIDNSAEAGSDYTATSGTLDFARGERTKTFAVDIRDDSIDEPNEALTLRLSNPSPGADLKIGTNRFEVPLNIIDNDITLPLAQFSSADYQVVENNGTATVTVTLNIAPVLPVSVDYATSDGTALAGDDYVTTTGTLNFAVGETSQTFSIPLVDDGLYEPDETLTLTLSNASNATLPSDPTATLKIADDLSEPTIQFSGAPYQVNETDGTATVTVILTAPLANAASVNYATSDGTALAGGDYITTTGTLNFAVGETSQTFSIPLVDDGLYEPDETLTLTLSNASGAPLATDPTATLTIVDDLDEPVFQFSGVPYQVNEADGTATVTVILTAPLANAASVNYATSDGTALAGSDYVPTTGTLVFLAGETSQSFTITITEDTLDEASETLTLTLSNASGAPLATDPTATLTIEDNDVTPVIQFGEPAYQVNEADGTATVTVTLNVPSGQQVAVDYATSDDTALAGDDYITTTGTLTFAPGETSQTFSIPLVDDGLYEPDETLTLTLSNASNATLPSTPTTTTLTIVDDLSEPTVQFSAASYQANEADGTATVTVTLNVPSGQQVAVDYATSDGTAEAVRDYAPVSGTLTFAPGETLLFFSVPISDDIELEADEELQLSLTNPTHAVTSTPSLASLTIIDDEPDALLVGSMPDVPNNFDERYFQTNGPVSHIGRGDWYGSAAGGSKPAGDHYLEIIVPAGWPTSLPIQIELFSPEMGSDPQQDENFLLSRSDTTFALYDSGASFVPPTDTEPGYHQGGSELFTRTYAPSSDPGSWRSFYTINSPVSGTYLLRAQSRGDSENKWGVRLLYDHDGSAATPLRNVDDYPDGPDGQPGTDDEIVVAIRQTSIQYKVTSMLGVDAWCQSFYQFVEPGSSTVTFHNYDTVLSYNTEVLYYSPKGRIYWGTNAGNKIWNGTGAALMHRVGDTIINPEPGWWTLQICTENLNQYIQEGQTGKPTYLTQPPTPDMQASMTSVRVGASRLRYTVNLTNTSDTSSVPGVAQAMTLSSQTYPAMQNVNVANCVITGSLTGTCNYNSVTDTLTVTFDGPLAAGNSSSVEFTATFPAGTTGEIEGTVAVEYEDMLGNRYVPANATDYNSLP
jgi:hypothetical protein